MVNLDNFERTNKPTNERFIDLIGNQYGRLTVLAYAGRKRRKDRKDYRHYWLCGCNCGIGDDYEIYIIAEGDSLERHRTVLQSCGCVRRQGNRRFKSKSSN